MKGNSVNGLKERCRVPSYVYREDRKKVLAQESSIHTAANASRQGRKKKLLHSETDVAVIILYL